MNGPQKSDSTLAAHYFSGIFCHFAASVLTQGELNMEIVYRILTLDHNWNRMAFADASLCTFYCSNP
jgi:hypothetical protein